MNVSKILNTKIKHDSAVIIETCHHSESTRFHIPSPKIFMSFAKTQQHFFTKG